MIYIIGTKHEIQHNDDTEAEKEKIDEYCKFSEQAVIDKKLSVLVEEASKDSLKYYCIRATPLESIAEKKRARGENCIYIQCDPGKKESKKLGIKRRYELQKELGIDGKGLTHELEWAVNSKMAPYDCLREKIWLEKIRSYTTQDMLFVCGYMHCETFARLLIENGHEVKIIKIIV